MNNDYNDIFKALAFCKNLLSAEAEDKLSDAAEAARDLNLWRSEALAKDAMLVIEHGKVVNSLIEKFSKEYLDQSVESVLEEAHSMFNDDPVEELEDLIDSLHN
jgi:hypothetical protein